MRRPSKDPEIQQAGQHWIQHLAAHARAGQIYLVTGPSKLTGYASQELIDRLSMRGQVYVIAGGNRYSLEYLPFLLCHQPELLESALGRIFITRAETCYQLLDALEHTQPHQSPLVVTDILRTLSEEDIEDTEAERLLGQCLINLTRLSKNTPVLISAVEREERPQLLERLRAQVHDEVRLLAPEDARQQPALLTET